MGSPRPLRIVLAKIGLDGHDRGIKVVARGLRDGGVHVIYAGLWQSPEAVVRAVADEDADWLGLSLLSGAHMTLVPRVIELLREAGLADVGVLVGGIVPQDDVPKLVERGVARVFGPGTPMDEIVEFLHQHGSRVSRNDAAKLLLGCHNHDRSALARLLSVAASGEIVSLDAEHAAPETRDSRFAKTIAITGGAGVGKSSLIGKLIEVVRAAGRTVAVLACDPQSSLTGGALLGDRIRMSSQSDDAGIFIRSLATPAGNSGVAPHLDAMTGPLRQFGFDVVIVETVGAGQGDTAVRKSVDVVVVLVQPETGDELQWEKAGQLEIADVVVVHKADLPGAEQVESQLRDFLNLPGCRAVPVVRVSSSKNQGHEELWQTISSL